MKHLFNKTTKEYENALKDNLTDYDNNLYRNFDNQYNHTFKNINLIANETKENINFIDMFFQGFIQNYLELSNFKKRNNLIIKNELKEYQIIMIFNKLSSYLLGYNINLTMYLDSLKHSLELNNIDRKEIETYLKENYNINRFIESIDIFFNQYFTIYEIDLSKKYEFSNDFFEWYIKDKTTKNNTKINEPQNNSNADTNTGEYPLTQKDRELLLSKKTKKNFLNSIITYQLEKYETISNIDKFNYFIDYCKKRDINKFTLQNLYYNKPKYSEITSKIKNENNELITLIQNIFKNAF